MSQGGNISPWLKEKGYYRERRDIWMRKQKLKIIALLLLLSFLCTGCNAKKFIYEDTSTKVTNDTIVGKKDMLSDQYYVKDGTSFYPIQALDENTANNVPDPTADFLLLSENQLDSVLTLYSNERICIKTSSDESLSTVQVERYKPIEWTLGVSALEYNVKGEYYDADEQNLKESSSIAKTYKKYITTDTFSISTINDDKPSISKAGTIRGLKKNESVQCGVYVGSEFAKMDMKSDSFLLESSESFTIDPEPLKELGYTEYKLPQGAKSGYYRIGRVGVIKYIDSKKAENKDPSSFAEANMFTGITYAIDDATTKTEYTKGIKVDENTAELTITLDYDQNTTILDTAYLENEKGEKKELALSGSTTIELPDKGVYTMKLYGYNPQAVEMKNDAVLQTAEEIAAKKQAQQELEEQAERQKQEEMERQAAQQQQTSPPASSSSSSSSSTTKPNQTQRTETYEVPENEPLPNGQIGNSSPGN